MTSERVPPPRPGTTRRRGATLERAILDAALDELREVGYAGLTMDAVARRAGTNKNAIYRRWPSRAALGIAAYRQFAVAAAQLPDTGELRGDVLELLRGANRQWASPAGEILRGLLASVGDDPQLLAELREGAIDAGSDLWLRLLARAVVRGEVSRAALRPRIATVAIVLLRNEFVVRGVATVPDDILIEIVDEVYLPLVRRLDTEKG